MSRTSPMNAATAPTFGLARWVLLDERARVERPFLESGPVPSFEQISERVVAHAVAGRDRRPLGDLHEPRCPCGRRRKHVGALPRVNLGAGLAVLGHHEPGARELAAPPRPRPFEAGGDASPARGRRGQHPSRRRMNGRTNRQNVTRAETGLPGRPSRSHAADAAVDDRFPRLDPDLPHLELADGLERAPDVVLFAHRDTAGGDQHVGALRAVEQRVRASPRTYRRRGRGPPRRSRGARSSPRSVNRFEL